MKRLMVALVLTACMPIFGNALRIAPAGAVERSSIRHTIIVYQENNSFDHYFGAYGHGVNGIPAGINLSHTSSGGTVYGPYSPFQLDGATQGSTCDVDHGYTDMVRMADHGKMNHYLQFGNDQAEPNPSPPPRCPLTIENAPNDPALPLGYYIGASGDPSAPLQNYWSLASNYTLADNFFQGMYGPSTPGAEWLVAATANTVHDPNPDGDVCNDYAPSMPQQSIPNLGAEASAKGVSWAWFQGGFGTCTTTPNAYSPHHDPFQYFTSTADLKHTYAMDPADMGSPDPSKHQRDLQVFYDALSGTAVNGTTPALPAVSWVKASEADDGHPGYSGPAADDAFIGDLVNRVKQSPYWSSTAIFVTFDETGGWWDHVAPPSPRDQSFQPLVNGSPNLSGCQYPGNGQPCGEAGFGPREPLLVVSPFARTGFIDHDQMDTSSLAQWVEWDYQLPALGVWGGRDRNAGSVVGAFTFS